MPLTYRQAGVDIDLQETSIQALVSRLTFKRRGTGAPLPLKGFFAGLISYGPWALALSTDNVGTKVLVADALGRWDTVGLDCVAVNVNDVVCSGAEPLAFVDYIAGPKYDPEVARAIGGGLNIGAREANVTVVGGEFACVPEITRTYDLSGTCLGVVAKEKVVTGGSIRPGDAIVGMPSSGLHSNGYTLARKVLAEAGVGYGERPKGLPVSVGEALLEPTRIYVQQALRLVRRFGAKGLAHISGGGLWNLPRLKESVEFRIEEPLIPPPIIELLSNLGDLDEAEMYQTFNMGMGMAAVVPSKVAEAAAKAVGGRVVGTVARGRGVSVPSLGLHFGK